MNDPIIDINGEEYIKLETLVTTILDYLIDGTRSIHSFSDQIADEICEFMKEQGRENLSVAFRKLYLQRRFNDVFGK